MKYSYEYKRMCVELYRQGKWPETPEGTAERTFRSNIRKWVRMENSCEPEALQHKNKNKGKIEIEYYSQAELERLIDLFESIKES